MFVTVSFKYLVTVIDAFTVIISCFTKNSAFNFNFVNILLCIFIKLS